MTKFLAAKLKEWPNTYEKIRDESLMIQTKTLGITGFLIHSKENLVLLLPRKHQFISLTFYLREPIPSRIKLF